MKKKIPCERKQLCIYWFGLKAHPHLRVIKAFDHVRNKLFVQVKLEKHKRREKSKLQSGGQSSSYHQSFSSNVRSIIRCQKSSSGSHISCGTKSIEQSVLLNCLSLQWRPTHVQFTARVSELGGESLRLETLLTTPSLLVMYSAKCVGTKPGATQLTRVSGAISAARA